MQSSWALLLLALPALGADHIERKSGAAAPAAQEQVRVVPGTPTNPRPDPQRYWGDRGYFDFDDAYYGRRWYRGRWWWFEPREEIWLYYAQDRWQPAPPSEPPPAAAAPAAPQGGAWTSPDGRRMVQVAGPSSDAFLYDVAGGSPRFMTRLAPGVERARFSGGHDGVPLKILLDLRDGGFSLFSSEGKPLEK